MAQSQTVFNKIIEDTAAHITNSVIAIDTGYVFLSGTRNVYNIRSFALTYVNLNGERQWEKIFGNSQNEFWEGWKGNYKQKNNSSYLAGPYVNSTSGKKGIHISVFDSIFNIGSQNIVFYDTIDKRAFYSLKITNNFYFITGQIYDYANETYKLILLKVDSNGNYLWHKSYGPNVYEYGSYLIETSNGEILTGGSTWVTDIENTRWYFLKTDTAGNVIWEKAYGRNNYNNGKVSGLIETQDSNYLACGVYPVANYGSETLYDGCLRKIDTAGELLWEKHYRNYSCHSDDPDDIDIKSSISSIFQESNGDLLILGSAFGYYPIHRGFLMKTNSKGQIKWHQYYYAVSESSRWQYFVDFKPTNEGGYILAGYGNDYSNLGYDPPQQAWLVKTDSLGMDGLSNTEPDALQVAIDIPDTVCYEDTIPVQIQIAGKSAPYTLSFSTGQVIDSIYYPPTFVPQEIGLGIVSLWTGAVPDYNYHNDTITEATITNHTWGHCIVRDVDFYTPAGIGAYDISITLTDAYGESTSITKHIITKSCGNAIAEENSEAYCRLFPNPASDKLQLEIPNLTQAQEATIYDAQGKLVFSQSINTQATTLDISNLTPGNYTLKINGISKSFTVVR
jgi:hypothetical protein